MGALQALLVGLPFHALPLAEAPYALLNLISFASLCLFAWYCGPGSGSSTNDSWDSGGDEVLRRRQIRNFATSLILHHGVPMILAGDEFRQTQYGNNNAYMADNSCGWIDWTRLTSQQKTYDYFRKLLAVRKAHHGVRRSVAVGGSDHDGDFYKDLAWHGTTPDMPDWSSTSHALAWLIDGSSAETGGAADVPDLYVASNSYWGNLTFTIPTAPNGKCWWLLADTADWAEGTGNVYYDPTVSAWNSQPLPKMGGTSYGVQARSTLVLAARPCNASEAIRVDFTVNGYSTVPGQDLYVVGNVPELGNWDVSKAVKLNYVSSSQWSGPVFFFASKGAAIQYKYLRKQSGTSNYEGGSNRNYTVPTTGAGSRNDTWQP